ncbi:hypothetical protein DQ04_01881080 [Trypanosoma grayi]|uniref:hypothetical protein n=1 Tax=Trypanosoma grayi TaxID=71804 RepID=UPI0004F495D0|nr:hypothetical protein DQ04_01881080 [Trypanosoma grayi]KEG12224.1 hypothetical protein DQ04_01881080 [Trypanosoma grayi]
MSSTLSTATQHSLILFVNNERCDGHVLYVQDDIPTSSPVVVPINTSVVRRGARRYNGLYELMFTVELESDSLTGRVRGRIVGRVLLPSGESHYLGPLLPPGKSITSAVFVEEVPHTIEMHFALDNNVPVDTVAAKPAELLLVDHVNAILDNDELCGSLASSHVQNLVRELPFYDMGKARFQNWSDFVNFFSSQYDSWEVTRYTEEQHRLMGFSNRIHPGELRLVSKKFVGSYMRADKVRDIVQEEALLEFQQLLLSLTGPHDGSRHTPRLNNEAFKMLGESRSFRTLNSVNYVRILRLVALDPERYVLFDQYHPIRIDWRRSDETTPGIACVAPS